MSFFRSSENESFSTDFKHHFVSRSTDQKKDSFNDFYVCVFFSSSFRSCSSDSISLDKILRSEEMFENIELLSSDLLYKLDAGHCYTLITDPLYSEILQIKLFNAIGRSTYFVIQIPFNEDMMSPRNATLRALREAHRAGCSCYLIYLANGIQLSRFLKFIDRFVIYTVS